MQSTNTRTAKCPYSGGGSRRRPCSARCSKACKARSPVPASHLSQIPTSNPTRCATSVPNPRPLSPPPAGLAEAPDDEEFAPEGPPPVGDVFDEEPPVRGEEGPWRRQLIRAALPRPEGHNPSPRVRCPSSPFVSRPTPAVRVTGTAMATLAVAVLVAVVMDKATPSARCVSAGTGRAPARSDRTTAAAAVVVAGRNNPKTALSRGRIAALRSAAGLQCSSVARARQLRASH